MMAQASRRNLNGRLAPSLEPGVTILGPVAVPPQPRERPRMSRVVRGIEAAMQAEAVELRVFGMYGT